MTAAMLRALRYTCLACTVFFGTLSVISIARADEAAPAPSGGSSGGIDPYTVGLIVAGAVAGGGGYCYGKSRRVTIEPQPLKVELAKTFVTKDELAELASRHDHFEDEMRDWMRESETRSHNRMDEIASKLDQVIGLLKGAGHNI